MKRILLLLSLFGLPLYAFGDFSPDRVRASAEARLSRVSGDGRYRSVTGAQALQLHTDGKGVTAFRLSLDRGPEQIFAVTAAEPNRCGRSFRAEARDGDRDTTLRIDELSADACRAGGKLLWRAELVTNEDGGAESRLSLEGPAEYFMLTQ